MVALHNNNLLSFRDWEIEIFYFALWLRLVCLRQWFDFTYSSGIECFLKRATSGTNVRIVKTMLAVCNSCCYFLCIVLASCQQILNVSGRFIYIFIYNGKLEQLSWTYWNNTQLAKRAKLSRQPQKYFYQAKSTAHSQQRYRHSDRATKQKQQQQQQQQQVSQWNRLVEFVRKQSEF